MTYAFYANTFGIQTKLTLLNLWPTFQKGLKLGQNYWSGPGSCEKEVLEKQQWEILQIEKSLEIASKVHGRLQHRSAT